MVCILCKISHRHHPSRHHYRRRPIYDACISCIFCDDICRDGHNTNNNVCANICYGNQSCHKKDCILCKINHRPSRHHRHHHRRPIYDACISCIFYDGICRDGHNRNNSAYAIIINVIGNGIVS